jgi:multidrug efflux pump subunit AcrA (membrane-fusion protein)
MSMQQLAGKRLVILAAVVAVVAVGGSVVAFNSVRQLLAKSHVEDEAGSAQKADPAGAATLIKDDKGKPGLKLSKMAVEGLQVTAEQAIPAIKPRALPAQAGTINFDNDRLFSIPSRFTGEVVEISELDDEPTPSGDIKKRPLRYGDRVKQGQLLGVVYSQPLGAAKAALVDAVCRFRLSKEKFERQEQLYKDGALSVASLKDSEGQMKADSNAVLTAERSLLLWQLAKEEVQGIKEEANIIHDQKQVRDADAEAKRWGRVELKVPVFDKTNKDKELVIVEKNTCIGAMVDPINTNTPLFRVADMSRLQIWAHPPEEYLPILRKMLDQPERGRAEWDVRFQSEPSDNLALKLEFFDIAPSLEPFNHAPMVRGYLDNVKGVDHLVGQFVTVTLFVAPEKDTVEIPTDALNEINGESLVFVQPDPAKPEYFIRRVVVVARFKDKSFVRSNKLTALEEKQSGQEVERGRRPLEPLQARDLVVTRGILEMTACLDELVSTGKR